MPANMKTLKSAALTLPACCRRISAGGYSYERYLRIQERLRDRRRELILFCEHPPTLTTGVQGRPESLLTDAPALAARGIGHFRIGRGGDYTAHEPGQCVIYVHIDLKRRGLQVTAFARGLLDVTARCIREVWGIETIARPDAPGLYLTDGKKMVSIGLSFKSFFTSHGLALNVSNDLSAFRLIRPCGDSALQMTSVALCGGDPALLERFIVRWTALFASAGLNSAPREGAA